MKKLFIIVTFIMVSTYSFADIQSLQLTDPTKIKKLGQAWHINQSIKPQPITDDMTIVYGGADISHKQVLNGSHSFVV